MVNVCASQASMAAVVSIIVSEILIFFCFRANIISILADLTQLLKRLYYAFI